MGRVHSLQQLGRAGSQFSATSGLSLSAPPFPGEGPLKATPEPSVAQGTASASCSDFKEAAWARGGVGRNSQVQRGVVGSLVGACHLRVGPVPLPAELVWVSVSWAIWLHGCMCACVQQA